MPTDPLPLRIDPFKLVKSGSSLEGQLRLTLFPRLCAELTSSEGEISIELNAGRDEQGIAYLAGHLRGEVGLICQRCLEPMQHRLDVSFRLGLLKSEALIDRLPDSYDPLVVAADAGAVQWSVLFEDELLLSLPIIPRHDQAECPAPEEYFAVAVHTEDARRLKPFVGLGQWTQLQHADSSDGKKAEE